MDQAPPAVPSSKPNWWKRNWKWFVPLGCLSVTIFFVAFVASIILIVFSAIKSTDVYKHALARAKADPAVIEALGSPIKEGFLVSGNTNVNGASGEANLAIPVSGPKGNGTIYVAATTRAPTAYAGQAQHPRRPARSIDNGIRTQESADRPQ